MRSGKGSSSQHEALDDYLRTDELIALPGSAIPRSATPRPGPETANATHTTNQMGVRH